MGQAIPVNVLFVDDRKDRYERLIQEFPNDKIDWAQTPAEAIRFLGASVCIGATAYDEFRLDYHLLTGLVDGNDVAHALACLAAYYKDTPVICHTTSYDRALKMQYTLRKKGFTAVDIESFDTKYPPAYTSKWRGTPGVAGWPTPPPGLSKKQRKKWWHAFLKDGSVGSTTTVETGEDNIEGTGPAPKWWERSTETTRKIGETKASVTDGEESTSRSLSPVVM